MLINPIIGYRSWELFTSATPLELASSWDFSTWPKLEARQAERNHNKHKDFMECTCGLYATKEYNCWTDLFNTYDIFFLYGKVALWGEVVEHESGYRAEYGYPLCFYSSYPKDFPRYDNYVQKIADTYNVPVEQYK